jgi:diguanylate cyclase (GGDEF)-like protein
MGSRKHFVQPGDRGLLFYADIHEWDRSLGRLHFLSEIPKSSRAGLQRQADMDLLTRLTAATVSYPFLLFMLGLATPFRTDDPPMFWGALSAIALAVSVRGLVFALRERLYAHGRRWMVVPLFLTMALSSGTAGVLFLNIMRSSGLSNWTFTMMLMWILGIAAGSTVSFTPSFSLLSVQLVLLFGLALPYELFARVPHGLSLGLATLVFVGFLLIQGHRLHGMYWDLLAERASEMQRMRELEAAKAASERAQEQLRYQATHDILTGVVNRAEILRICGREVERAMRQGTSLGVVMIDLDHFKQVNDRFGHLGGDEVLRCVSERVAGNLRPYDAVGRYGGEEFLVVLPSCDRQQSAVTAERIRSAIAGYPVRAAQTPTRITASFGVTVLDPTADTDQLQMIARADSALYEAKKNGRNRVAVEFPRIGAGPPASRRGSSLPEKAEGVLSAGTR